MRLMGLLLIVALVPCAMAADDEAGARKNLTGVWVGRVDDGATGHQLTVTAEQISGRRDKRQDLGAGTFQLDLTKKPWQMDATRTKGGRKGEKYLGIFSLDGDTLKWCVSTPGNDRPTEFATRDSQFLLLLKRQPR